MKGSTKFWLSAFIVTAGWYVYNYITITTVQFTIVTGVYLFIALLIFGLDKLAKRTPFGQKWNIFWGLNWAIKRFNTFLDIYLDI